MESANGHEHGLSVQVHTALGFRLWLLYQYNKYAKQLSITEPKSPGS